MSLRLTERRDVADEEQTTNDARTRHMYRRSIKLALNRSLVAHDHLQRCRLAAASRIISIGVQPSLLRLNALPTRVKSKSRKQRLSSTRHNKQVGNEPCCQSSEDAHLVQVRRRKVTRRHYDRYCPQSQTLTKTARVYRGIPPSSHTLNRLSSWPAFASLQRL